jgi:hypothetical protein
MRLFAIGLAAMVAAMVASVSATLPEQVRVDNGMVSGVAGISAGVRAF